MFVQKSIMSAVALLGLAAFTPNKEPVSPDGTRAVVDLPPSQHMKNVGGSDGAGLCVFTSIQHAAFWQNIRELDGFRKWMERRPGGGWPEKVDEMVSRYCKETGAKAPTYIQHTGGDESFLEAALHTDRIVCVTYGGKDDFYKDRWGRPAGIYHMVNLAHLDTASAAIIDNNRPGYWVWMTRKEFLDRWRDMSGGWAIVFLASPPPPHLPEAKEEQPVFGQNCPGGRCPVPVFPIEPKVQPGTPPAPIGSPPTPRHYWGYFPELRQWGWRLGPEVEAAPAPRPAVGEVDNFGVDPSRIHNHPAYSVNGVEITRPAAHALLKGGPLLDDSDRWHLTCVGGEGLTGQFKRDVAALPEDVRAKLLVQCYTPDRWEVQFFQLTDFGVCLRKPSPVRTAAKVGTIPGAEYSAARLRGLLETAGGPLPPPQPMPPAPQPTPQPQPNPSAPTPDPAPAPAPVPTTPGLVWLLLGVLAAWLLTRKQS